jgi:hypothetical protein
VTAAIFAHQGGWDEVLFVAVPIAIFAGLLAVANRRASQIEEARNEEARDAEDGDEEAPGAAPQDGPGDEPPDRDEDRPERRPDGSTR